MSVDGGPSFIVWESAAVGGLPTFTNPVAGGQDGSLAANPDVKLDGRHRGGSDSRKASVAASPAIASEA